MTRAPRVLLSAYACEPGKSSEQGVGWNWARHLAAYCDVTVVTRGNNRAAIERECASDPVTVQIRWIYHDLPKPLLRLKRLFRSHRLYYSLWQRSLIPRMVNLCQNNDFDIAHHLTFASCRYTTALARVPTKNIWGPIGGVEYTPWNLLPWGSPSSLCHEAVRNLQTYRPLGLREAHLFDRVLSCTHETQDRLAVHGIASELMPTIGIDRSQLRPGQQLRTGNQPLRLLFVGNLQHLKGIHFVIDAVARTPLPVHLSIAGNGPYAPVLKRQVSRLSVAGKVSFLGFVPHKELNTLHDTHDVFVFPSLHDSGGLALLEAMASAMPSITLACGGPRVITNSTCGIQIPLGSSESIVQGIANAIQSYAGNPEMVQTHGSNALRRVKEDFLWENKAKVMFDLYRELLEK